MKKNYVKMSFEIVFLQTDDIITGSRANFPEDGFWNGDFDDEFQNMFTGY